jgi:putative NADH-flavin reductase
MRLAILGGTGELGRALVVAAHRAGHTITVMARNAAGFVPPVVGVRMVVGDARDATDVERAVAGQDAVVWAVRVVPVRHGADVFEAGIPHVVAAMREHRVRRLVCISCAEAPRTARERFSPSRFARLGRAAAPPRHDLREAPVRDSDLDWTIVRPAGMTNRHATGLYQALATTEGLRTKRIPRADVAAFIVENLGDPEFVHRTVALTG